MENEVAVFRYKGRKGLPVRSVGLYFRAKRAENTDNAVHDSLNKKSIKLAGLGHDLALSHLFCNEGAPPASVEN